MKRKINNQKIILVTLTILFLAASFEIIVYFFYIYKPANQIFSSKKSFLLEIPAISEILKPNQIANESISLEDTRKSLYIHNLLSFQKIIDKKINTDSTFVKDASINYILTGIVTKIEISNDNSIIVTLNNSTGNTITETFSADDLKLTKVRLIILSITSPKVEISSLEKAIPGDRLIIKSSSSILESTNNIKNEIEIHRIPKS